MLSKWPHSMTRYEVHGQQDVTVELGAGVCFNPFLLLGTTSNCFYDADGGAILGDHINSEWIHLFTRLEPLKRGEGDLSLCALCVDACFVRRFTHSTICNRLLLGFCSFMSRYKNRGG
jgi:hypothetical protein